MYIHWLDSTATANSQTSNATCATLRVRLTQIAIGATIAVTTNTW